MSVEETVRWVAKHQNLEAVAAVLGVAAAVLGVVAAWVAAWRPDYEIS